MLGRSPNNSTQPIDLKPYCTDISANFNDHFLSASGHTQDDMEDEHNNYLRNYPDYSLYLPPVTQNFLSWIWRNFFNYFKTHIQFYFPSVNADLSFKSGNFPDKLIKAKVIPLFKSCNRNDVNSYRPISILPAFSKVFAKAITIRLVNYFENNNLLSDWQHGFRSGRSTESAILQFTSNIHNRLEKKHYLAGVFIDLSKTFDSFSHIILLCKLYHYATII